MAKQMNETGSSEVLYEVRDEGTGITDRKWTLRRNGKVLKRSKMSPGGLYVDASRIASCEAIREGVTIRVRKQDLDGSFYESTITPEQARENRAAIEEICRRATTHPASDRMTKVFE